MQVTTQTRLQNSLSRCSSRCQCSQPISKRRSGHAEDNFGDFQTAVQRLRLRASAAGGLGSTPGRGTEILPAAQRDRKEKEKTIFDEG